MRRNVGKALVICIFPFGIFWSACGEGREGESAPAVRDSSGVAIIENRAPAWEEGEGWRLAPAPELDLGGSAGPARQELFRVSDAIRLSDGRIVIANGGSGQLLFFDPRGRLLFAAGGEGGGPGEFRSLARLIVLPGDSVLVWDPRERRFSVFGPDGSFGRSFRVEALRLGIPEVGGRYPDGSLLLGTRLGFAFQDGPPRPGPYRDTLPLLRYAPDDAALDTLLRLPGREVIVRRQGGAVMSGPRGAEPDEGSLRTGS